MNKRVHVYWVYNKCHYKLTNEWLREREGKDKERRRERDFLQNALFLVPSGPSIDDSGMVSLMVSSYCSSFCLKDNKQ